MKTDIHPEYVETSFKCSCGNSFKTRSTVQNVHVEICGACHPFYTGDTRLVDSAGRIEKFKKRYGSKK
ncbi:MAG: large subunit ribosomal protein L31 [Candidatus Omnitrophota bacterium]|jgi:large subunit ribosomal protein L31